MLLDGVIDYLPFSFRSCLSVKGYNMRREEENLEKGIKAPLAALAFKVANDSFVGTLTYVRVYAGKITSRDSVWNPRSTKERAYC